MQTSADFSREKLELQKILSSGIFHRAPNLAHLLTYVCEKYFEGTAEQLKEYNIAVDALGRPVDFDQKRDSIVRVEAHRLRKRLREYYDTDGADHPVSIDIPPGQYAPKFVRRESLPASLSGETLVSQQDLPQPDLLTVSEVHASPAPELSALLPATTLDSPLIPAAIASPRSGSRRAWFAAAALLVSCTGALALWNGPMGHSAKNGARTFLAPIAGKTGSQEVRILAGHVGGDYTDRLGRVWQSDRYAEGGSTFETVDHPISGTREPRIYQSRREGAFAYDIPLAPGVYEMRLHFAETLYGENNVAGGGESSRVFNVLVNGKEILREFDVISEAGPSTADVRAFKDISPAADGKLHLKFEPFTNPAQLSAIEITPGIPGKLRPIRLIALDRAYTDKQGSVWEPDRYARGGLLAVRTRTVEGSADPELFQGERFGNLRYVIPVPAGRYGLTLHFAEAWFGPGAPPGGGVGSRVFDILCNGVVLRRAFDIFKEAQGAGRATAVTVHGLEPDAQGKLNIALTPIRNYASINALEVTDESR